MKNKQKGNQAMSSRLYLRKKDHIDAVYEANLAGGDSSGKYAYLTSMYSVGLDGVDDGFIWKRYPKLSALTLNGSQLTSDIRNFGMGVMKDDSMCIFSDYQRFTSSPTGCIKTDKYGIFWVARTGSSSASRYYDSFYITKDGYEFKIYTDTPRSTPSYTNCGAFGFDKPCLFSGSVGTSRITMNILVLDIEEDGDTLAISNHTLSTVYTSSDYGYGTQPSVALKGSSDNGILFTITPTSRDKVILHEVRESGFFNIHTFAINTKAGNSDASIRSGEVRDSTDISIIVKCGNYYIFAVHRISVATGRALGSLYVYKSVDLINWTIEPLIEEYQSALLQASKVRVVTREDVCYIYATITESDGKGWKTKGFYSTRGQVWSEITFPESIIIKTYDCKYTEESKEPYDTRLSFVNGSDANTIYFQDIIKSPPIESASSVSTRLQDGANNVFFEYGKLKDVNKVGFVSANLGMFLFLSPMLSENESNFAICKKYGTGYFDNQYIQEGDYCV